MSALEAYDYASTVWKETSDYEAVLRHLRDKGVSKLESIKALREFCEVSLGEAKQIASSSDVWADTLADSKELHDTFFEGATEKE